MLIWSTLMMTLTTQTVDWRETLAAGQIVSFVFPSAEGAHNLEKNRPALILSVDRSGPEALATVAYGTSRRTDANTGLELHVRSTVDMAMAGLHRRTRFVGARTTIVPLTSARFVTCRAGTAVLGSLPERLHDRLAQVASRCRSWPQRARSKSHGNDPERGHSNHTVKRHGASMQTRETMGFTPS